MNDIRANDIKTLFGLEPFLTNTTRRVIKLGNRESTHIPNSTFAAHGSIPYGTNVNASIKTKELDLRQSGAPSPEEMANFRPGSP
jgi:hypothetical protein